MRGKRTRVDDEIGQLAGSRIHVALLTVGLVLGLALAAPGWATSHADAETDAEARAEAGGGGRPDRQSIREVCEDDIARACGGAEGRAATFRCLEDHEASLMPECRVAVDGRLDRIKRRMDELIGACQPDIDVLCGGDAATLHRGEIFQCLDAHRDSLSEICSGALGSAHGKHRKHGKHDGECGGECRGECGEECRGECGKECRGECTGECEGCCGGESEGGGGCGQCHAEFERLCPDTPDHAALHACVEAKQEELSAECRTHFGECQSRQRGDEGL